MLTIIDSKNSRRLVIAARRCDTVRQNKSTKEWVESREARRQGRRDAGRDAGRQAGRESVGKQEGRELGTQ